jgi:hypothetical protein
MTVTGKTAGFTTFKAKIILEVPLRQMEGKIDLCPIFILSLDRREQTAAIRGF